MAFDNKQFILSFPKTIARLGRVEGVTKAILKELSRDLLSCLHGVGDKSGDIGFINQTISALSPVNKRAFILFTKEHTGFILNDEGTHFTKKSKKHYDAVQAHTLQCLLDPHFNVWSWQEKKINMEVEPTPFTIEKVQETVTTLLKKATKANISKGDIVAVLFNTGFTVQDILDAMEAKQEVVHMVEAIDAKYDIAGLTQ